MDAEEDLLALRFQRLHEVAQRLLGLGHSEAVAGYDDHLLRVVRKVFADLRGARVVHFPVLLLAARARSRGGDAGEDDLAQRTSQSARHQTGENGTRSADQRAADDEGVVGEYEARGRRGEPSEGIQERDHDGHVRPADGDYEQDTEQQGSAQDQIQRDERREHDATSDDVYREKQDYQEYGGVDNLLKGKGDGPGQCQLLQLGESYDAPRAAHRTYNNAEEDRDGGHYGLLALA